VRTPDSRGGDKQQLYADNVAYMDKLVGKLMDELDSLHLREKTLVIFTGDNGTARFGAQAATVNGKPISGQKVTMLEGGSRVPLIANWPGTTHARMLNHDLHDFSDFFATFAELGGAKLPAGVTLDSHSFAAQIKGRPDQRREWVYVELNGKRYVRDARWKLNNAGEMFDLRNAPFVETLVPKNVTGAEAVAARERLQTILTSLVGKKLASDGPPTTGRPLKRAAKKNS
jgi:arylsulfatase A